MKKEPTAIEQSAPKAPKAPEDTKGAGKAAAGQEQATGGTAAGGGGTGKGGDGGGASGVAGSASSLLPAVTSPKGGGAIRGIGEKFSVNAATGTAALSVPIATSPGRSGFGPELSLSYDSGSGNGPFGLGFHLSAPAVTRKTDKGLPRYWDGDESDVYVMSGAEDLVPERRAGTQDQVAVDHEDYRAYRYRPRVEGAFVRIERWVRKSNGAEHWRVTTKENVTHIYGQSDTLTLPDREVPEPRIADPENPRRVFSWLLEESHDDKGNIVRYEYKAEDGVNVPYSLSEKSRFDANRNFKATAQRYLKRILYGNRQMRVAPATGDDVELGSLELDQYLFEVVFDYGEHSASAPSYSETATWPVRQDPFSSYRSCFDVRTYRLCRRVMVFHRFGTTGSAPPVLVKSTDFRYEQSGVVTYLLGVTHWGYIADGTGVIQDRGQLPELTFAFQPATLHDTLVALPQHSLDGLRGGIDGGRKQWIDLDGEGIPGVLIDADGAWYYKSNLGDGQLTPPRRLATIPSPSSLTGGLQKLEDLGGDGQLDLVQYSPPLSGYFSRTPEGDFEPLRNFQSLPNIDWNDPNLRFVDLDGDGFADLLITEDNAFVWYHSNAKQGFGAASRVFVSRDENKGPAVVFADGTQSIQLSDMSGDGLVDIVRVRNGEVCYWPNLGYGKFGPKITLEHSPVFAPTDEFDARRVRFSDIDGSGTSDLFYLGTRDIAVYLNESGNRLSARQSITSLPPVDNVAQISIVDLLGQGTSCLVWSSSLQSAENRPVFYIDLMGGIKPHLLHTVTNNLGAQTRITYSTSTVHYLRDKAEGLKWLTRLSFPVQVVDQIVHEDLVSSSRLTTLYRYHHGFYDGAEREFRGFAAVEQWDAERLSIGSNELEQPPTHTKTWFHTGAWLERERLESALKLEYFPPGDKDPSAPENLYLPDTVYEPDNLGPMTTVDEREASRALRGHTLRTEVYADDASDLAAFPYIVTEQNFAVRRIQSTTEAPHGAKHGIFFAFPRETLTIHTERHIGDPRVAHELILQVNDYGDVKRKANIVYARRQGNPDLRILPEQGRVLATVTETEFFNSDELPTAVSWYRAGVQFEQRTFELTGFAEIPPTGLTVLEDLRDRLDDTTTPVATIAYESSPGTGPTKRLIEHSRQYFYPDALGNTPLDLGEVESHALPFETYQLALTAGIAGVLVGDSGTLSSGATPLVLVDIDSKGFYAHPKVNQTDSSGDANYWVPSGRIRYDAANFYLPVEATDPFNQHHYVTYDDYKLLIVQTRDPLGNIAQARNDYRVLAPDLVTDPNLNRTQVGFDSLGRVLWMAVMGKDVSNPANAEGDSATDPTSKFEYHLNVIPAYVKTSARERHRDATTPWQDSFAYSDGFGRIVQQKVQAEPGEVPGVTGTVTDRWVGTGRTVFNNKGNPVKQYEPFFSQTSAYESEASIVERGVTPIIHYDPLDRVIRTDLPNGTFSRVLFDAWKQETWDPNDTVTDPSNPTNNSQWYTARINGALGPQEQRAAQLAAAHAGTPTTTHLDSLGRAFLTDAWNRVAGVDAHYFTKTTLDIEGNQLAIMDARQYARGIGVGSNTIEQKYDVLGRRYFVRSADAGDRLTLLDVAGKPLYAWDSRHQRTEQQYDELQRPTRTRLRVGATETLVARSVYGEALDSAGSQNTNPNALSPAQTLNLRGQGYLLFDSAGLSLNDAFDFKGNLLSTTRHLATTYTTTPDWASVPDTLNFATFENDLVTAGLLEVTSPTQPTRFTTTSTFDALNRVTSHTTPDGSVTTPTYNRANLLETVTVQQGTTTTHVITDINYNEKGQRILCRHGESASDVTQPAYDINYSYDPKTFRLARLWTLRADTAKLQDLNYTYDPVGNITEVDDNADWDPLFSNTPVSGNGLYEYDAVYRLIHAEGREHPGQQVTHTDSDVLNIKLPNANDLSVVARYEETYQYDPVGNITEFHHQLSDGTLGWTRTYTYETDNNRLATASEPVGASPNPYPYAYNEHGSMTSMAHLQGIDWDFAERMQRVNKGGGGNVFFTYDASGQRVRKVWVHNGITEERIYLGSYEIYRRTAADYSLERQTLHVMDDQRRVAMVETKTVDTRSGASVPTTRWRFQLDNHLGSAMLEVDAQGQIVSYEEYHPYGTSALRLSNGDAEVSAKRYRYTGKERDEETSLYYHGARYYAPWLGRWTAADPIGVGDGVNLYAYVQGSPLRLRDAKGMAGEESDSKPKVDNRSPPSLPKKTPDQDGANAKVKDTSKRKFEMIWPKLGVSPPKFDLEFGFRVRDTKLLPTGYELKADTTGVAFKLDRGGEANTAKVTYTGGAELKTTTGSEEISVGVEPFKDDPAFKVSVSTKGTALRGSYKLTGSAEVGKEGYKLRASVSIGKTKDGSDLSSIPDLNEYATVGHKVTKALSDTNVAAGKTTQLINAAFEGDFDTAKGILKAPIASIPPAIEGGKLLARKTPVATAGIQLTVPHSTAAPAAATPSGSEPPQPYTPTTGALFDPNLKGAVRFEAFIRVNF